VAPGGGIIAMRPQCVQREFIDLDLLGNAPIGASSLPNGLQVTGLFRHLPTISELFPVNSDKPIRSTKVGGLTQLFFLSNYPS
jgi:hypothetical protein